MRAWGTLYTREPVDDELGEGFRMYTQEDRVFESRVQEPYHSRLYEREDGDWYAGVLAPVTRKERDETVEAFIERINMAYDTDCSPEESWFDAKSWLRGRAKENRAEDIELGYNRWSAFTKDVNLRQDMAAGLGSMSVYTGGGAGAGAAIGAAVGGPGGAVLGAYIGTMPGMLAAWVDLLNSSNYGKRTVVNTIRNRWVERAEQKHLTGEMLGEDLLETVTRYNALNWLPPSRDLEEVELQREELSQDNPLETLEDRVDTHFDVTNFAGVYATRKTENYGDAATFISTVQDSAADGISRPSIYEDLERFADLFEHLYEDGESETYVRREGTQMIESAFREGADPAVQEYLEAVVPEQVDSIAARVLEGENQ